MTHWTERSVDDFLYRIATDFVMQLENRIQSKPLTKAQLAQKLGVSKGRVSQILNNPGNLTLKMIIKCARALGMKVAVVAYADNDEKNERGPVNSEIFRVCWENAGKPIDFWALKKPRFVAMNTSAQLEGPYKGMLDFRYYVQAVNTGQAGGIEPVLDIRSPIEAGVTATNLLFHENLLTSN